MAKIAKARRRLAELEAENEQLRAELARLKAARSPAKSTNPTK